MHIYKLSGDGNKLRAIIDGNLKRMYILSKDESVLIDILKRGEESTNITMWQRAFTDSELAVYMIAISDYREEAVRSIEYIEPNFYFRCDISDGYLSLQGEGSYKEEVLINNLEFISDELNALILDHEGEATETVLNELKMGKEIRDEVTEILSSSISALKARYDESEYVQ